MHIHQPPSLTPIYPVTLRQLDPLAPSLFSLETKQCLARPCLPRATFTLLFLLAVSQPDSLTRCHPFFLSRSLSNSLACSTLSIPCTTPSLPYCRMRHEEPRNLVGGQYFHWLDKDLSEQRGLCWKIFLRLRRYREGGDSEEGQRKAKKGEEARIF